MNCFADAFLISGRNCMAYYEIIRLKQMYSVSAAAMLVRLGQLGILSRVTVQHAFATFARSWRRTEPEPIRPHHGFAAFEKPRRFKRLFARAVGE